MLTVPFQSLKVSYDIHVTSDAVHRAHSLDEHTSSDHLVCAVFLFHSNECEVCSHLQSLISHLCFEPFLIVCPLHLFESILASAGCDLAIFGNIKHPANTSGLHGSVPTNHGSAVTLGSRAD